MKIVPIGLALLLLANISAVFISPSLPNDPALFGEKPFHAHTLFEIKGVPADPSRWTASWGPNRPGNPRHHSQTEVELKIAHGVRDVSQFVYVEILADSQGDANAVLSLLEKDFSQAYAPAGQWQESNGRQHIEEPASDNRFFWRQRFELLLIGNSLAIFCLLAISIFSNRKPTISPSAIP